MSSTTSNSTPTEPFLSTLPSEVDEFSSLSLVSSYEETDAQPSSCDVMRDVELEATVTLTEYLFTRLYQLGVRSVQGVPGDFNLKALDYLESTGLKWSGNSAELSAGYAADGYARIKGIAALMTVFGVGELSAINAIAGSYSEKVPVVHIVGTTPTKAQDKNLIIHHSLGDGNHRVYAEVYKHFTCAQANLRDLKTSTSLIDSTLQKCIEESQPVYIELPFDMIDERVSTIGLENPILNRMIEDNHPELENHAVQDILRRIYECTQPVIVVDGFARRYGIADEVNRFLHATGIIAVSPPFGQGIVKEDYPHYRGVFVGPAGSKSFMDWFQKCDLVMHIAPLKSDANTCNFKTLVSPGATIELDQKCISVFGAKYCNLKLKSVFDSLLRSLDPSRLPSKEYRQCPKDPLGDTSLLPAVCSEPIDQARLWPYMSQFVRSGDIVIADIGTSWTGTDSFILPPDTTLIKSGIWFSIGSALGACVGAAHAQREMIQDGTRVQGRTIVFEGDGSFQVTVQALSDIIRNRLDVVIFVINNSGYTIERLIHGKDAEYNCIQPWNYTKAAKFFGAPEDDPDYPVFSRRVSQWGELRELLDDPRLQHGKGFNLVEVVTGAQDSPQSLSAFMNIIKGATVPSEKCVAVV